MTSQLHKPNFSKKSWHESNTGNPQLHCVYSRFPEFDSHARLMGLKHNTRIFCAACELMIKENFLKESRRSYILSLLSKILVITSFVSKK